MPTMLGNFDRSQDLINAPTETIIGINKMVWNTRFLRLGETLDYFNERQDEKHAVILQSFLGRVAADAYELLGRKMPHLRAILYSDIVDVSAGEGVFHEDTYSDFRLGLRYITTNKYPTEIKDLEGINQPGHIARMPHNTTIHRRPAVEASIESPRIHITLDI
jgi:hypothetical protein